MSETVNVSDEGQRDPVPSDWRGDGAEYLTVPLSEEASERLCSATYFTDEWLKGHEDDEECVLPVNHVQTLLTLADAVVIRSGKARAAARAARENSPVPAPARETTIPEHVQAAWYVVAQYVGIPGETARRQLGVLDLARIAFVSKAALDALAEASKFFPEFITAYEGEWRDGEWGWETRALKRLLDCISTLTDSPTP